MAATLTAAAVDCGPGNFLTIAGSGLVPGTMANVAIQNQGFVSVGAGVTATPITASFTGTAVSFTVPDALMSNEVIVTAGDGSQATFYLDIQSQYLQAAQYNADGEGFDTSALSPGVLDEILRDASAIIDEHVGGHLRLLQGQEDHRFTKSRRIWPFRSPRKKIPIVSLDALTFITSNAIQTAFNVAGSAPDVYTNKNSGYFEVQTYAVGNAILLGAIQTIGFSADVWRVTYTAGYGALQTPRSIRKACALIATELMDKAKLESLGMGPFQQVDKQFIRRKGPFVMPEMARSLLRPYAAGTLA
jgi:hypothetical protein